MGETDSARGSVDNRVSVVIHLGEAGYSKRTKEFDGESVHIGGFQVVSPCLLDHGVSTVKDLFLARHHARSLLFMSSISLFQGTRIIVISMCKNDSIKEIFGRRRRSGSDPGVDLRDKRINVWTD